MPPHGCRNDYPDCIHQLSEGHGVYVQGSTSSRATLGIFPRKPRQEVLDTEWDSGTEYGPSDATSRVQNGILE